MHATSGNTRLKLGYITLKNLLIAYWPVIAVWVMILAFNWPVISPFESGREHIVKGDFVYEYFPFHHFGVQEWWSKRIPLWDPYVLGGFPYQADPQSALFYPVGLLISFLSGPGGLTEQLLVWETVLDQMLAAAFMYAFVRQLTKNKVASTIGASAFTFSGYLTSYPMQAISVLETAIWIPLVLLFIERGSTRTNRRWTEYMLAGLAFGISVLAGHPQTVLYEAYFVLAYFLFRAFAQQIPLRSIVMNGLVFLVSAIGLSAVQILPMVEFATIASRGGALYFGESGHGYALWSLNGLLLTGYANEKALYAGAAVLILLLMAWLRLKGQTVFWSVAAVATVILSLGNHTPLFSPFYSFAPGYSLFKDQERIMVLFAIAVGVLGAFGYQNLIETIHNQRRKRFWALFMIGALLLVLAGALTWIKDPQPSFDSAVWGSFIRLALFLLAALLVLALGSFGKIAVKPFGVILVVLVSAELFMVNFGDNFSLENPLPSPKLITALRSLNDYPEPFRIMGENHDILPTSYGSTSLTEHIEGETPMLIKSVQDLLDKRAEWRVWQLFNVRFIVAKKEMEGPFELRTQVDDIKIYHVLYTLPRVWAVSDVKVVPDNKENLQTTLSPDLDPGFTVVLERQPTLSLSSAQSPNLKIDAVSKQAQRWSALTETTANSMLVFSEVYYQGWRAYIDGHEVPIYRANHGFRSIELPSGTHKVEMRYIPISFFIGLGLTSITVIAVVVLLWYSQQKKKRSIDNARIANFSIRQNEQG
jgi:hypothetical protein